MKINGREVLQGGPVGSGYRDPKQGYPVFSIAQAIVEQAAKDYVQLYKKAVVCGAAVVIRAMEGSAAADNAPPDDTALDFRTARLLSSLHELESFFMSQWFEALSDCDPARLMRLCRELAKKRVAEKQSRANTKQKACDRLPDANAARTPRSRQRVPRSTPLSSPQRDPWGNPIRAPYTPTARHIEAEWMDWGGGVGGRGRSGGVSGAGRRGGVGSVGGAATSAAKRRIGHEITI